MQVHVCEARQSPQMSQRHWNILARNHGPIVAEVEENLADTMPITERQHTDTRCITTSVTAGTRLITTQARGSSQQRPIGLQHAPCTHLAGWVLAAAPMALPSVFSTRLHNQLATAGSECGPGEGENARGLPVPTPPLVAWAHRARLRPRQVRSACCSLSSARDAGWDRMQPQRASVARMWARWCRAM